MAHLVQSALEHARGPLALVESGAPLLVPVSRRLAKKLGDLVQIVFVLFDWQPAASSASSSSSSSSLLGASNVHGSGHGAHFASDLISCLEAFSHGLVFEPQQDSSSGGGGGGGGEEDGKRTLHHMRLITAAIHSYLSGLSGGGGGSVAPAAAAAGEGSSDHAAPAATTASETLTSMRERLSLALVRGPLGTSSERPCEFESRFAVMRTSSVALDMLHALCRADFMQQATQQAVRPLRSTRLASSGARVPSFDRDELEASPLSRYSYSRTAGDGGDGGGGGSGSLPGTPLSEASAVGRTPSLASLTPSLLGDAAAEGSEATTPRGPMDELMEAMLLPLRPAAPPHSGGLNPLLRASASSSGVEGVGRLRSDSVSSNIGGIGSSSRDSGNALRTRNDSLASLLDQEGGGDASRAQPRLRSILDETIIQDHF